MFAAAFLAATLGTRAEGASVPDWTADLAPVGACANAEGQSANLAVKRQAVTCLVNWARRHHSRHTLTPSRPLWRASVLNGGRVAFWRVLSHASGGADALV